MGSAREERDLSQRGQSMIEYALLIVLVVLMALGLLGLMGTFVGDVLALVDSAPRPCSCSTRRGRPAS